MWDSYLKKTMSKLSGYYFDKLSGKYRCEMKISKVRYCLGSFDNEMDAALCYDAKIKELGLKRRLNFPDKEPENDIPNTRLIRLTKNQFAVVDAEDFESINQFKWTCISDKTNSYAVRSTYDGGVKRRIHMHSVVLGVFGSEIDHINGNGLHNYKSNLRLCSRTQNMQNRSCNLKSTSKHKGVSRRKVDGKYVAQIQFNHKGIYLGLFESELEASIAYNNAAIKYFGEFARLNVID